MKIYLSSAKSVAGLLVLVLMITFMLGMMFDRVKERIVGVTTQRQVAVNKVDTPEKKVAITLDGFWGEQMTPKLLEILKRHNVKVSWFFGGPWVEKNPDLVKQIATDGHEIENHSYTHSYFDSLTPQEIRNELEYTSRVIQNLTGRKPRYFRPPFGSYNDTVIQVCAAEGYQVVQGSIDTLDQQNPGVNFIVQRVVDRVSNGEIIIMNNNGRQTPDALEILLPKLKEMGYQVVPLSELFYRDNYYIESHSGVQKTTVP